MSKENSRFSWENPLATLDTVTVTFEGEPFEVPAGISVAAALLGHTDEHFCHSAAEDDERAPYCLMGVCFECLVEIDGVKNRQACLEPVFDGMQVKRQRKVGDEEQ
jgi:predicted molibdopterin-dependent oxidoreductase YjgC